MVRANKNLRLSACPKSAFVCRHCVFPSRSTPYMRAQPSSYQNRPGAAGHSVDWLQTETSAFVEIMVISNGGLGPVLDFWRNLNLLLRYLFCEQDN